MPGLGIDSLAEGESLANQMGQAALAVVIPAVSSLAIGDQPADKGGRDHLQKSFLGARADEENDTDGAQRHPEPAQSSRLIPGGFIEMQQLSGLQLLD